MLSRKLNALVIAAIQRNRQQDRQRRADGPAEFAARGGRARGRSVVPSCTISFEYGPIAFRSSSSPITCMTAAASSMPSASGIRWRMPAQ